MKREAWESAFLDFASRNWNVQWQDFQPTTAITEEIDRATADKYSRNDYNQKR